MAVYLVNQDTEFKTPYPIHPCWMNLYALPDKTLPMKGRKKWRPEEAAFAMRPKKEN